MQNDCFVYFNTSLFTLEKYFTYHVQVSIVPAPYDMITITTLGTQFEDWANICTEP